jgi:hypothetical protein
MSDTVGKEQSIVCREARKRFALLNERDGVSTGISVTERAATNRHLQTCSRCAMEYRLFALQRATLDAAAGEPITPDENFFKGLRARIARGPEPVRSRPFEDSWAAALFVTGRQLVPAMAVLLLLMVGATLLWNQVPSTADQAVLRPRDRVVFSDIYDYPAPTRDDVLETLVAVEEK